MQTVLSTISLFVAFGALLYARMFVDQLETQNRTVLNKFKSEIEKTLAEAQSKTIKFDAQLRKVEAQVQNLLESNIQFSQVVNDLRSEISTLKKSHYELASDLPKKFRSVAELTSNLSE